MISLNRVYTIALWAFIKVDHVMNKRAEKRKSVGVFNNIVVILDDLWLAQCGHTKKPTWYLYKIGKRFAARSLRTEDKATALALALEAYKAYQIDPDGNWLGNIDVRHKNKSFNVVAHEWLKTQNKDAINKVAVVRKFLVPYFDGVRKIPNMAAITPTLIEEYKQWRRSFWLTDQGTAERQEVLQKTMQISAKQMANYDEEPSPNTLNREYPTLRQILKHAHKQGLMGHGPAPDVPAEDAKANPRPAFLGDDFDTLMDEAEKWITEATNFEATYRRSLLADWIYINRWTGLRVPHEAEKLTWADVRLDMLLLFVSPDTKTGKREVPFDVGAAHRLTIMKQRRIAYLKSLGKEFSEYELVFCHLDGNPFKDFPRLFAEVVRRCDFPRRTGEMAYTAYSLRHTYATFALAEGKTYEWLEEVMGTSMLMLKEHYKNGTIEQTRRYLASKAAR